MICLRKQKIIIERTSIKVAVLFLACLVIDLAGHALAAAETQVEEVVGEIISLDITANMLTIRTKQEEMSFHVNEKTQITMGKEEKHFSDLKVGDKVKVHYTVVEGKEVAERIMVRPLKRKEHTKRVFDQ
jgi:Cu/Ag efflux protein CusF